mmetsp:Transcript_72552/g.224128  ORF Transcript_72552/g.224128 Transcript_72552/m.224128 type:complete len:323 (+) Transcript_72552:225-1193(+)
MQVVEDVLRVVWPVLLLHVLHHATLHFLFGELLVLGLSLACLRISLVCLLRRRLGAGRRRFRRRALGRRGCGLAGSCWRLRRQGDRCCRSSASRRWQRTDALVVGIGRAWGRGCDSCLRRWRCWRRRRRWSHLRSEALIVRVHQPLSRGCARCRRYCRGRQAPSRGGARRNRRGGNALVVGVDQPLSLGCTCRRRRRRRRHRRRNRRCRRSGRRRWLRRHRRRRGRRRHHPWRRRRHRRRRRRHRRRWDGGDALVVGVIQALKRGRACNWFRWQRWCRGLLRDSGWLCLLLRLRCGVGVPTCRRGCHCGRCSCCTWCEWCWR